MFTVVPDHAARDSAGRSSLIDEIVREGARRMLAEALQAEVDAYIARFAEERDESGRRLVVRNGCHEPRTVLTSAGAVEVTAPRVNDKRTDPATGDRMRFSSAILPPWCRKTPKITEVLPLLYLHGLSSGDFVPALGEFLGSAAGLSAAVITKLTETWKAEATAFAQRDLSAVDYVYVWADGIHVGIRLEEHKLCLLVLIGVRADGRKELIALADGYRESSESWADLLRDCARRGMRAPVLAVGDGALGFWAALREVFPQTREGRCWFHKIANVLAALPKSAHPGAKKALAEIWNAEGKDHARTAVKAFEAAYGAKFPKAVAKITGDLDQLLALCGRLWCCPGTANPDSCGMACAFRASPRRCGAVPALHDAARDSRRSAGPGGRHGRHRPCGRACLCDGSGWQRCAAVGRQVDSRITELYPCLMSIGKGNAAAGGGAGASPASGGMYSDQHLRVSDAEREAVTDRLAEHFAAGRLDQAEFDDRVGRAMSATTRADLSGLFAGLSETGPPAVPELPGGGGGTPGAGPGSPIEFRLAAASGVPTYLQLVHQVEHALRLGYLKPGDQLPKVRDVVASLAINPNTVLKAYKELEIKGLAAGRPGQGTFVQATLSQVALPELAALRRSLSGWLTAADGAGLDEDGIVALFTSALRDFYDRRCGSGGRGGAAGGGTEGVA